MARFIVPVSPLLAVEPAPRGTVMRARRRRASGEPSKFNLCTVRNDAKVVRSVFTAPQPGLDFT